MAEVWYTADLHLSHRKLAELRGFDSVEEHDAAVFDNWAATVGKDDSVWVLGDLTLGHPAWVQPMLSKLPGRKHLILGNHDRGHPVFRNSHNQLGHYTAFHSVQLAARRRIGDTSVLLSHLPYSGDHTAEDRHPQWRLPDCGEWLLHGHTHSPDKYTGGKQIHVGLDAWGLKPASTDQVRRLMVACEEIRA